MSRNWDMTKPEYCGMWSENEEIETIEPCLPDHIMKWLGIAFLDILDTPL